jgi:hypothetical protein
MIQYLAMGVQKLPEMRVEVGQDNEGSTAGLSRNNYD